VHILPVKAGQSPKSHSTGMAPPDELERLAELIRAKL
jgi:hypothetical protein